MTKKENLKNKKSPIKKPRQQIAKGKKYSILPGLALLAIIIIVTNVATNVLGDKNNSNTTLFENIDKKDIETHVVDISKSNTENDQEVTSSNSEEGCDEGVHVEDCPISEVNLYQSIEDHLKSAQVKYKEFDSRIKALGSRIDNISSKDTTTPLILSLIEIEKDLQKGTLDKVKIRRTMLLAKDDTFIKNNLKIIEETSDYKIKTTEELKKDFNKLKITLNYSKGCDRGLLNKLLERVKIYINIRKVSDFQPSDFNNADYLTASIEENIRNNKWDQVLMDIEKFNKENQEILKDFKSHIEINLKLKEAIQSSYEHLESLYTETNNKNSR